MQLLRDILKRSLAASLSTLTPADRLAAAWPVVAGHALAARVAVLDYRAGTLTLGVEDDAWRRQVESAARMLQAELAKVSGLPVTDILVVPMPRPDPALARPDTP